MSDLPDWKNAALAALPQSWTIAVAMAAVLIVDLPDERGDDWPTHDPALIAAAALEEGRRRFQIAISASAAARVLIIERAMPEPPYRSVPPDLAP